VLTNAVHQQVVVDMIEAALNVPLDNPLIRGVVTFSVYFACLAWPRGHTNMLECTVAAPTRTESVRDMPEACFEYGLQKLLDRRLHDAIRDRGNAQGSELPWFARLEDEFATARTRPVGAAPECSVQFSQVRACTLLLANAAHGHPVDTWCALPFVPGHAIPGAS
jgi:hypothetical protein